MKPWMGDQSRSTRPVLCCQVGGTSEGYLFTVTNICHLATPSWLVNKFGQNIADNLCIVKAYSLLPVVRQFYLITSRGQSNIWLKATAMRFVTR